MVDVKIVNKFGHDLEVGFVGEDLVRHIIGESKIECKRDLIVSNTENVAIEYEYNGKPSGIAATDADWWALILNGSKYKDEIVVLIKTERLKEKCRKYLKSARDKDNCGDDGKAKNILLPKDDLFS